MRAPDRRGWELGAILIGLGVFAGLLPELLTSHHWVRTTGGPVFGDFIAFWSAGHLALEGRAVAAYLDPDAVRQAQLVGVPGIEVFTRWRSAPPFLLIVAPLAALPYPLAAAAFHLGSCGTFLAAAARILPDRRALLFPILMPWVCLHILVQTGPLVAGLFGLALVELDRRPVAAGAAIGLLVIKPHLAVVWPIVLVVRGQWAALASAAVTALALSALTTAFFGIEVWGGFVGKVGEGMSAVGRTWRPESGLVSLYSSLRGFGLGHPLAAAIHVASSGAAIAVTGWVWGRGDRAARIASVCAATLLVSPYLFYYDLTLLGVAGAAFACDRVRREELPFVALAWGAVALCPLVARLGPGPLAAALAWMALVLAARRAASAPVDS